MIIVNTEGIKLIEFVWVAIIKTSENGRDHLKKVFCKTLSCMWLSVVILIQEYISDLKK